MAYVSILLALAVGWLGWTWWLCIPIGFLLTVKPRQPNAEPATHPADPVFLTAPLTALFFIFVGYKLHSLVAGVDIHRWFAWLTGSA